MSKARCRRHSGEAPIALFASLCWRTVDAYDELLPDLAALDGARLAEAVTAPRGS